jgi:hypothetical protein
MILWGTWLAALIVLGVLLFHAGVYPPVWVSILAFALAVWWLRYAFVRRQIGLLMLLLFGCYTLPFVHIVPYIWFDWEGELPGVLWGLAANPYMTDRSVIELMALVGALGSLAFGLGTWLAVSKSHLRQATREMDRSHPVSSLSLPVYVAWTGVGVLASWLTAPRETLFEARYTEGVAVASGWDFSSLWMISYAVLVFALADAMVDHYPKRAKLKKLVFFVALLIVVLWFQLLRGDRESLTLVVASVLMLYGWGTRPPARRGAWGGLGVRLIAFGGAVVVVSLVVGLVRSSLVGVPITETVELLSDAIEDGVIGVDSLFHGTWSAVLLTPLSVAGDYVYQSLPLKFGATYRDLLISTIPGFVANWIGFERPIDSWSGPAWEMTYGIGGTHAVVVPFMNFRIMGIVLIVMAWSFLFAQLESRFEKRFATRRSAQDLAFLGVMALTAPHWLWYGEKYVMNALIIWAVLLLLYRASSTLSRVVLCRVRVRLTRQPAESVG